MSGENPIAFGETGAAPEYIRALRPEEPIKETAGFEGVRIRLPDEDQSSNEGSETDGQKPGKNSFVSPIPDGIFLRPEDFEQIADKAVAQARSEQEMMSAPVRKILREDITNLEELAKEIEAARQKKIDTVLATLRSMPHKDAVRVLKINPDVVAILKDGRSDLTEMLKEGQNNAEPDSAKEPAHRVVRSNDIAAKPDTRKELDTLTMPAVEDGQGQAAIVEATEGRSRKRRIGRIAVWSILPAAFLGAFSSGNADIREMCNNDERSPWQGTACSFLDEKVQIEGTVLDDVSNVMFRASRLLGGEEGK